MAYSTIGNPSPPAIPDGPYAARQCGNRPRTVGIGIIFTKKGENITQFHIYEFNKLHRLHYELRYHDAKYPAIIKNT